MTLYLANGWMSTYREPEGGDASQAVHSSFSPSRALLAVVRPHSLSLWTGRDRRRCLAVWTPPSFARRGARGAHRHGRGERQRGEARAGEAGERQRGHRGGGGVPEGPLAEGARSTDEAGNDHGSSQDLGRGDAPCLVSSSWSSDSGVLSVLRSDGVVLFLRIAWGDAAVGGPALASRLQAEHGVALRSGGGGAGVAAGGDGGDAQASDRGRIRYLAAVPPPISNSSLPSHLAEQHGLPAVHDVDLRDAARSPVSPFVCTCTMRGAVLAGTRDGEIVRMLFTGEVTDVWTLLARSRPEDEQDSIAPTVRDASSRSAARAADVPVAVREAIVAIDQTHRGGIVAVVTASGGCLVATLTRSARTRGDKDASPSFPATAVVARRVTLGGPRRYPAAVSGAPAGAAPRAAAPVQPAAPRATCVAINHRFATVAVGLASGNIEIHACPEAQMGAVPGGSGGGAEAGPQSSSSPPTPGPNASSDAGSSPSPSPSPSARARVAELRLSEWGIDRSTTGEVTALSWSPDRYALACSYASSGLSVWSPYGSLLFSSLGHGGRSGRTDASGLAVLAARITAIAWGAEGFKLHCASALRPSDIVELPFARAPFPLNTLQLHADAKPRRQAAHRGAGGNGGNGGKGAARGGQGAATTAAAAQQTPPPTMTPVGTNAEALVRIQKQQQAEQDHHVPRLSEPSFLCDDRLITGARDGSERAGQLRWDHIAVPRSYLARNWPLRVATVSPDGAYFAVAGRRGLLTHCVATGRWRGFRDPAHEDAVAITAMAWSRDYVAAAVLNESTFRHELALYPRGGIDRAHEIRSPTPLPSRPLTLDAAEDRVVVFLADATIAVYPVVHTRLDPDVAAGLPGAHSGWASTRAAFGEPQIVVIDGFNVAPIVAMIVPSREASSLPQGNPWEALLEDDAGGAASASTVALRGQRRRQKGDVAQGQCEEYDGKVESQDCGYDGEGGGGGEEEEQQQHVREEHDGSEEAPGSSEGATAGSDPRQMRTRCLILSAGGTLGLLDLASGVERVLAERVERFWVTWPARLIWAATLSGLYVWSMDADGTVASPRGRVTSSLGAEAHPIATAMPLGVVIGVRTVVTHAAGMAAPRFEHRCEPEPFLPCLLLDLLRPSVRTIAPARRFSRRYRRSPFFLHSLERLLHACVEEDPGRASDALLERAVALLASFEDVYVDVVVSCIRKTDIALWPRILDAVGSPGSLFDRCLAAGRLESAACTLLVVRRTNGTAAFASHGLRLTSAALARSEYAIARDVVDSIRWQRAGRSAAAAGAGASAGTGSSAPPATPPSAVPAGVRGSLRVGGAERGDTPSRTFNPDDDDDGGGGASGCADVAGVLGDHARNLLMRGSFRALLRFSGKLAFGLHDWLVSERERGGARPASIAEAIVAVHNVFAIAFPEPLQRLPSVGAPMFHDGSASTPRAAGAGPTAGDSGVANNAHLQNLSRGTRAALATLMHHFVDARCPEWSVAFATVLLIVPLVADLIEDYPRLVDPMVLGITSDSRLSGYEGVLVFLGLLRKSDAAVSRTTAEDGAV